MAERVARDEDAEPDARRPRGERGEQRPGLEAGASRRAVGVDEVVHEPGVVEAQVLGHPELVEDLRPGLWAWLMKQPKRTSGWRRHGRAWGSGGVSTAPAPAAAWTTQRRGVFPVRAA